MQEQEQEQEHNAAAAVAASAPSSPTMPAWKLKALERKKEREKEEALEHERAQKIMQERRISQLPPSQKPHPPSPQQRPVSMMPQPSRQPSPQPTSPRQQRPLSPQLEWEKRHRDEMEKREKENGKEDTERVERERKSKEEREKREKETKDREKKEREEKERREKEKVEREFLEKERMEREKKEKGEREKREKEIKEKEEKDKAERKEREERERAKEIEENERKERRGKEEKERKEKDLIEREKGKDQTMPVAQFARADRPVSYFTTRPTSPMMGRADKRAIMTVRVNSGAEAPVGAGASAFASSSATYMPSAASPPVPSSPEEQKVVAAPRVCPKCNIEQPAIFQFCPVCGGTLGANAPANVQASDFTGLAADEIAALEKEYENLKDDYNGDLGALDMLQAQTAAAASAPAANALVQGIADMTPSKYFEGFMMLKESGALFWRKRWFSIQDRQLIWYPQKVPKDTVAKEYPPEGFVDLAFASKIEPTARHDGSFEIVCPEETTLLFANSVEEMHQWITRLYVVVEQLQKEKEIESKPAAVLTRQNTMVVSYSKFEKKEGWLEMKCFLHWSRVWIVIQGGMMFVHSNQTTKATQRYPLYRCVLDEYHPESIVGAFHMTITHEGGKKSKVVLRAPCIEEMHYWLNFMVKQKLAVEETIDCITVNPSPL
eukprot:TRINITY_DN52_c4_g1_i1.p1 TRINITY_DN52_c4_g1~~TRINITY_DN52_c4_g1_i1.p1  ORF type:complete len:679 (+),score=223.09 TRINITY_DN52_c4_g1_i1:37-2037(+)